MNIIDILSAKNNKQVKLRQPGKDCRGILPFYKKFVI